MKRKMLNKKKMKIIKDRNNKRSKENEKKKHTHTQVKILMKYNGDWWEQTVNKERQKR